MKVECPACSAQGKLEASNLPREGREVTCPRCGKRFRVWPERTGPEIIQQRERMVCPKCGGEQPIAEVCAVCGIVVQNFIRAQERQREIERLEFVKLRSEVRRADSWYHDLFDRRLVSILVRVLSLLIVLGMFMTCSMKSTQQNRSHVVTIGESSPARPPALDDKGFKEQFDVVVGLLSENTDLCFTQCYNYLFAWYQNGGRDHYLTPSMEEDLNKIKRNRSAARSAVERLPTPTKPHWECYYKVKHLNNLNDDLYKLSVDYDTYYRDFGERLAALSTDYKTLKEELFACRDSFK